MLGVHNPIYSHIKINYALFFKHFILIYVHVYVLRKKEECVHFCRGDRKSEIHICYMTISFLR